MESLTCLHSRDASIVLEHRTDAAPAWRHCGARVDPAGLPSLTQLRGPASFSLDRDVPFSCAPGSQPGWFGRPTLLLRDDQGKELPFRPQTSTVEQDASAIRIDLRDDRLGVSLEQEFRLLEGGAFRLRTRLTNHSVTQLVVTDACSAMLPLCGNWQDIVSWRGRHNAELAEQVEPMPAHGWLRETRRGISGHGGAPGVYLLSAGATRDAGLVLSLQLAWSGDSRIAVERDDEGFWILSAAATGTRALAPGETITLPDAILAISTSGRNGAMAQQHSAVREMLSWPGGAMSPRAVHLNSWEACYFDHDEDRIVALARSAAQIGAERFVLDDGWFKGRNSDNAGLGDWTADPVKYPGGLGSLAAKVTAMGLEFGLWVEPEMVNPDSDLCRAHPDWVLAEGGDECGGARPTSRNQLVLDMRRPEVRDYLFSAIDRLLRDLPVGYLKWDHNRDHAPSGGPAQVLGTYDLLQRLRAAHPGVEIEGCAGGGGRSDAGLVSHVHRFWTSDNVDAVARIGMQRGFLAFLPPEIMGAHVGASPCHATGRIQPLAFRAAIACMGHLGVELDPATLSEAERSELAGWLAFYKQWRSLVHGGEVLLGEGSDRLVWQAQGRDGELLLFVIRSSPVQDRRPQPLALPFAARCDAWTVRLLEIAETRGPHVPRQPSIVANYRQQGVRYSGSWLAANGLPLPAQQAESVAIFHLVAER